MQMCSVACENVSALSVDGILQMHFLQAGALWHLLLFLFDYDYTLEEGGVAADGKVAYIIMAFTQYPKTNLWRVTGCVNFALIAGGQASINHSTCLSFYKLMSFPQYKYLHVLK